MCLPIARIEVYAYLLTLDHTYDQVLQARPARKMMGQLAAQANITLTSDDVKAWYEKREIGEEPVDQADLWLMHGCSIMSSVTMPKTDRVLSIMLQAG